MKVKSTVKEMIQKSDLYNGLNNPGIHVEDCDIVVFGVPFDGSVSARAGAKEAPKAIRELTFWWSPTTERFESLEGLKILDWGDTEGNCIEDIFSQAEEFAFQAAKSGKLFTVLGGDHSITIPIVRGINKAVNEQVAILHFDAHPDLLYEMDGNIMSHGSVHRRTLECDHFSAEENLFLVGIRSLETEEMEFIRDKCVNTLTARDVYQLGITECVRRIVNKLSRFNKVYLTLDIDCLDPAYAAGTGTPQFGGLSSRELLELLEGVFSVLPIIGFDIVEVAPSLDPSITSVYAARKLLVEMWGNHFRKLGRLTTCYYPKG